MPLHPQARAMIESYAAGPEPDFATITGAEFRAAFTMPAPTVPGPEIAGIEERRMPRGEADMRLRLYRPLGQGPFPITLYLHGGGFVIGTPEATDSICQTLAAHAGTLVVSPEYRLAPEAPFPAGVEDCRAALVWAHAHAAEIGGIASKMAVAGDSAGGNLAAVLAQSAKADGPKLCHQLLLYPVMDCSFETRSYREFADGYLLTAELMRWFWRQYLADPALASDWRASPLRRTDLAGLAEATIVTAEYDVLRDEGEAYASALQRAGVPVTLKRWPGQIHGFLLQQGLIDDADTALVEAAQALRRSFA